MGDVFSLEGESLTGGPVEPGPPNLIPEAFTNTTLVVLATDAALSRIQLFRLVVRAHDALAACLRPVHTDFDGDVVFAASVGTMEAEVHTLAEAAFGATGRAIENAIRASNV